jgi:hypothetical protein
MKAQGTVSKADDLEFLQSEYPPGEDYPNDDTVETWLRKEGLVDAATGSWKFPKINREADLYDPLLNIFSKIVARFVTPKEGFPAGVSRKVIKTPNTQLQHVEDGHYSSPDFMAQAEGPSFETPSNGSPFGFANMATFFDAKVDGDIFYVRYVTSSYTQLIESIDGLASSPIGKYWRTNQIAGLSDALSSATSTSVFSTSTTLEPNRPSPSVSSLKGSLSVSSLASAALTNAVSGWTTAFNGRLSTERKIKGP